jgi:hypothetical protein
MHLDKCGSIACPCNERQVRMKTNRFQNILEGGFQKLRARIYKRNKRIVGTKHEAVNIKGKQQRWEWHDIQEAARGARCASLEYTCYTNAFSAICHASFFLTVIYCRHLPAWPHYIGLLCIAVTNYFPSYFIEHSSLVSVTSTMTRLRAGESKRVIY